MDGVACCFISFTSWFASCSRCGILSGPGESSHLISPIRILWQKKSWSQDQTPKIYIHSAFQPSIYMHADPTTKANHSLRQKSISFLCPSPNLKVICKGTCSQCFLCFQLQQKAYETVMHSITSNWIRFFYGPFQIRNYLLDHSALKSLIKNNKLSSRLLLLDLRLWDLIVLTIVVRKSTFLSGEIYICDEHEDSFPQKRTS